MIPTPTLPPADEFKRVTVMFADLSGFTALAERLDPEEIHGLINACFDELVPVIDRYGGTVDKFLGDAVLALFGAPVAHENDPERALRAALEMVAALAAFNERQGTDLDLHFGINTGRVVAGRVGSRDRQEYSVMGDAVNVAKRLEESSERGEILVGPDTQRLTAALFEFEGPAPLAVRGRSPVEAYRLVAAKTRPGALKGIAGLRSPIVGRNRELDRLRAALHGLGEGRGGVLAILGEAGQGKSRLVAEARQSRGKTIAWVEGRALSYTEGMSYWAARDLLAQLLGIPPDARPAEIEAPLRRGLRDRFPAHESVYPYFARLLEAPMDEKEAELLRDVLPEALQRRLLNAYRDLVRARALEQPLVLVWEDLHWADPSSLQVLEGLLSLTAEAPLLVMLVFRPDEGRAAEFHERMRPAHGDRYDTIEVTPLSRDESAELLENLLDVEDLPERMRQLILEKGEGNAFYIEEVLRSLIDAGVVVLRDGRAVASEAVSSIDVPDTLQGVIAARVDRLPPDEKRTLQTAAVIGRFFQQRVLGYVLDKANAAARMDTSLAELKRRELIRLRAVVGAGTPKERAYLFKHAVTHDVTYESLLSARRRELHRASGEAVETLFSDQIDDMAATLAYHYERGEAREKAIDYLTRAADRAKATYANREAIDFYRRAIEQIRRLREEDSAMAEPGREKEAELLESLGEILEVLDRHEDARAAFHAALDLIPPTDSVRRSRLHRESAGAYRTPKIGHLPHRFEEAIQALERAEAELGPEMADAPTGWWREWLNIQICRMYLCYWRSDVAAMARLVEKMQPVVELHSDPEQRAEFFSCRVLMAFRRDRYVISDETMAQSRAATAAAQQANHPVQKVFATFQFGFTNLWRGNLEVAEERLKEALPLAERTGDVLTQMLCLTYLTILYRKQGKARETRVYAERSLETASAARMANYLAMARANLGWLAWREGDAEEAERLCRQAMDPWPELPTPFEWVARWILMARAVSHDDLVTGIEHARALIAEGQQPPPRPLEAALGSAIEAWESGRPDAARSHLEEAFDPARELGFL